MRMVLSEVPKPGSVGMLAPTPGGQRVSQDLGMPLLGLSKAFHVMQNIPMLVPAHI